MMESGLSCPHHFASSKALIPFGALPSAVTADARARWLVIRPLLSWTCTPALAQSIGISVPFRKDLSSFRLRIWKR